MADFCTQCSDTMFPDEIKPDIDVITLWNDLKVGEMYSGLLCEGCTLIAISKPDEDNIHLLYLDAEKDRVWPIQEYKDLIAGRILSNEVPEKLSEKELFFLMTGTELKEDE